jgi:CrcB protein
MKGILLVGLGGFAGSVARYKLGGLVLHLTAQERFPWSTFAINVAGCLLAGVLAGLAEEYDLFGPDTRLLVFTGLLGGFTTFSAFGLDALFLLRRGEIATALLYAGGSVVVGLAAAWVGWRLVALAAAGHA